MQTQEEILSKIDQIVAEEPSQWLKDHGLIQKSKS